jgi:hypothetical protein
MARINVISAESLAVLSFILEEEHAEWLGATVEKVVSENKTICEQQGERFERTFASEDLAELLKEYVMNLDSSYVDGEEFPLVAQLFDIAISGVDFDEVAFMILQGAVLGQYGVIHVADCQPHVTDPKNEDAWKAVIEREAAKLSA